MVEGDSQPCLHDIGIKSGDTCAEAGFNLFFQQFQRGFAEQSEAGGPGYRDPDWTGRNVLVLTCEYDNGSEWPTFVDDDAVLLCGDSPSQLIDKIQEATRICLDMPGNFGLTLNVNQR